MSRRKGDKYICEECDCNTELTKRLKKVMKENDMEVVEKLLEYGRLEGKLNPHKYNKGLQECEVDGETYRVPTTTKEQTCMFYYYNPNGIYNE